MGYYHVNRTLKGILIEKFDLTSLVDTIPDQWLPNESWVVENYPEAKNCGYGHITKSNKLTLLGCLEEIPYVFNGPSSLSEINEQFIQELYDDEYDRVDALLPALAVIYCYQHNYPVCAFECFSDYDDTWMFVCALQFPPEIYNENLSKLTEKTMAEELSQFLSIVTGRKYNPQLQWCEEYIKE